MTQRNDVITQPVHSASLGKRMLQGGAIALILIVIFLSGADESKSEWGKFWMIKPHIMVPLAGAMGGVFYYFMDHLRHEGGWKKVLAHILTFVVFITGLWMGFILGLDGTLWD